jgi:hypothetical protein
LKLSPGPHNIYWEFTPTFEGLLVKAYDTAFKCLPLCAEKTILGQKES